MASTAATPLSAPIHGQIAARDDEKSPFLRLPPELRNWIYQYAFVHVRKTGLVPHALTHVNKQIRNESRPMYYASIECIEIDVRTLAQIEHTEEWLAEEDWSMFPVLPDLKFLSSNLKGNVQDITISCYRETVVPAHDHFLQLAHTEGRYVKEQTRLRTATMNTYTKCLGFDPEEFRLDKKVPDSFTQAIKGEVAWSTRRLEYNENDPNLRYKFLLLALDKHARAWTKDDIGTIVK
jgi:hypothetical protein